MLAVNLEVKSMFVGDFLHERQSESSALTASREKRVKKTLFRLGIDADSVIFHAE